MINKFCISRCINGGTTITCISGMSAICIALLPQGYLSNLIFVINIIVMAILLYGWVALLLDIERANEYIGTLIKMSKNEFYDMFTEFGNQYWYRKIYDRIFDKEERNGSIDQVHVFLSFFTDVRVLCFNIYGIRYNPLCVVNVLYSLSLIVLWTINFV